MASPHDSPHDTTHDADEGGGRTPDIDDLRERLEGLALPDGEFVVEGWQAWLTADTVLAPPPTDDRVHPIHVSLAGLQGVGYPIQHLFDLMECRLEDGPLIGATDIRTHRALRVDERVIVTSTITAIDRKRGSSGVFDRLTLDIALVDADGDTVGELTNTFIYPRPEAA